MQNNCLDMLNELRAIAQTGIIYAKNPYDLSQYTRIRELASDRYAEITGLSARGIINRFSEDLDYITAKIGVN